MRLALFVLAFFTGIFCCFWTYVWTYRVPFMETALQHVDPSYIATIGSLDVEADTLTLNQLVLIPTNFQPPLTITKAVVHVPVHCWLYWILVPSTAPLHLTSLSLTTTDPLPSSFVDHLNEALHIDSLEVVGATA